MQIFQEKQRLIAFLKACLECSVYLAPTEPGLTYDELLEVGKRAGFQPGEISDALQQVTTIYLGRQNVRLQPAESDTLLWLHFAIPQDGPDYRNPLAFDFIFDQLRASARANGILNAKLERSVVVERAVADQIPRRDVQAAITIMILAKTLQEKDGILSFARGRENFASPREQLSQQHSRGAIRHNEARAKAYLMVKDIVERRFDGRPKSAEPLDAFAESLDNLGYGNFRLWWTQMVAELRQASTQTSPVAATVLSAALVEGALTFVVKHARALNLGVMGSKSFEGNPTSWRIDDLISSAASGGKAAILDNTTQLRASALIRARQRIHAGRMLSEFPGGPPDLRPEEARDAQQTAEQVVRRIVDWLQQHPTQATDH